ncbi:hypothetical protein QA601_01850 [Chitinispirillales bacterium ANBcel5]|uniref:hypothetical protein n=1 Tax=Cellulosispirillum alkaliphilum TaxID=3039283 RepID=UPI002A55E016|nr:hypothetical protein [Chitinispirillales bacterium ANBcel5]
MTAYEAYDKLAPVLMNETFETIRRPDMPVDVSAHEGQVTVTLLRQDEEKLKSIGYDISITDRIKEAVGTFCVAEAKLTAILGDQLEAVKVWREHRAEGYMLRKKVLKALRFACREDKEAMEKLKPFPRRPKQEIMILNLHFLSELGKKYQHHLEKINFNMATIESCKTFGDKLSRLYAHAYSEEGPCQMRVIRNKAFTLMKSLIAEARAFVTYLFGANSERLKLYSSAYRRKNYRYRSKKRAALKKKEELAKDTAKNNESAQKSQTVLVSQTSQKPVSTDLSDKKEGISVPKSTSEPDRSA